MKGAEQLLLALWCLGSLVGIYAFAACHALWNPNVRVSLTTGTLQSRASWFGWFFLVFVPFGWVAVLVCGVITIDVVLSLIALRV